MGVVVCDREVEEERVQKSDYVGRRRRGVAAKELRAELDRGSSLTLVLERWGQGEGLAEVLLVKAPVGSLGVAVIAVHQEERATRPAPRLDRRSVKAHLGGQGHAVGLVGDRLLEAERRLQDVAGRR